MFDNLARKIVLDYTLKNFKQIEVKPGMCRMNFKCHLNAVHDAIENNDKEIAVCIYIDSGRPIIHFVNWNRDGVFTDNTIGHWSKIMKYYFIEHINRDQFGQICSYFEKLRRSLKKLILPWYIRPFVRWKM